MSALKPAVKMVYPSVTTSTGGKPKLGYFSSASGDDARNCAIATLEPHKGNSWGPWVSGVARGSSTLERTIKPKSPTSPVTTNNKNPSQQSEGSCPTNHSDFLEIESVALGSPTNDPLHGDPKDFVKQCRTFSLIDEIDLVPTQPYIGLKRCGSASDLNDQIKTSDHFRDMMATNSHFSLIKNLQEIEEGDVLIVAPEPPPGQPRGNHGFIAIITQKEPLIATMLELAISGRKLLGSTIATCISTLPGRSLPVYVNGQDGEKVLKESRSGVFCIRDKVILKNDHPLDRRSSLDDVETIVTAEQKKDAETMLKEDIGKGYVFKLSNNENTDILKQTFEAYALEVSQMHPQAIHQSFNCNSGVYYTVLNFLQCLRDRDHI